MTTVAQPLLDRVLLRRVKETVTKAGIIIPETADVDERPDQTGETPDAWEYEVVAVGMLKNAQWEAAGFERILAGNRVLVRRGSGVKVKINGEMLLVVTESELMVRLHAAKE